MPPCRPNAVPASAAEVAQLLDALGDGPLAVAARWAGSPGRSELVALLLLAAGGEHAGNGVLVSGDLLPARSVVKKLNEATVSAMHSPVVKERLEGLGAQIVADDRASPDYLRAFVKSEIEKWAGPIKASGATAD